MLGRLHLCVITDTRQGSGRDHRRDRTGGPRRRGRDDPASRQDGKPARTAPAGLRHPAPLPVPRRPLHRQRSAGSGPGGRGGRGARGAGGSPGSGGAAAPRAGSDPGGVHAQRRRRRRPPRRRARTTSGLVPCSPPGPRTPATRPGGRRRCARSARPCRLPILAIGGITLENVDRGDRGGGHGAGGDLGGGGGRGHRGSRGSLSPASPSRESASRLIGPCSPDMQPSVLLPKVAAGGEVASEQARRPMSPPERVIPHQSQRDG